jgi:hypothetical protein
MRILDNDPKWIDKNKFIKSQEATDDEIYMLENDIEDFELKMLNDYINNLFFEVHCICNKYP